MTDEELLLALQACRIAHHIPGRLRVKLGATASGGLPGRAEASALLERLRGVEGVRAVSVNALARSCTVDSQPAVLPPAGWEDLLAGRRSEGAERLLAGFALAGLSGE